MSELRVRKAIAADLETLVGLLAQLFSIEADFRPDAERQRSGLAMMLDGGEQRVVLVAERDGAVVGMVTAQLVVSTAEGGPSATVEDMIVEERERGRGVGQALLLEIERWARERGATRLQLLADRENAPAIAFYERMGWRPTRLVCFFRAP